MSNTRGGPVAAVMKQLALAATRPLPMKILARIPTPRVLRRGFASPRVPWPPATAPELPEALRGVPGVVRDEMAQQKAFEAEPSQTFELLQPDAIDYEMKEAWRSFLPVANLVARSEHMVEQTRATNPARAPADVSAAELTRQLRERAREQGLGAIGVTAYDPKYTFEHFKGREAGDTAVVVVLEQHYGATQACVGTRSNSAAWDSTVEAVILASELAEFLKGRGHRAYAHSGREAVLIPYAVQAGLGQLGLNGQLLTPHAGSRCRLALLTTDATLVHDEPIDYGIPAICDKCQVCVRRCPTGAITAQRKVHRGVEKAKVWQHRCFPAIAQADGCAVCMKVCPVQRYGLDEVLEHYKETGEIRGRGTEELESYQWPLDHQNYGPGERPKLDVEFFDPPGWNYDPDRRLPSVED